MGIGGIMFAVLGVASIISMLLPARKPLPALLSKIMNFVPLLVGLIAVIGGIAVAMISGLVTINDHVVMRGLFVAALGAGLFFLGAGLAVLWFLRSEELRLSRIMLLASALAAASIGVLVIGIASPVSITGFGGLQKGTVTLAGAQLVILSLLAVGLVLFSKHRLMERFASREVLGVRLSAWGMLLIGIVVAMEGLIVMSIAAPFSVQSIGGMGEGTMMLGAGLLAALGFVMILCQVKEMPERRVPHMVPYLALLFLLLLVPFAVVV